MRRAGTFFCTILLIPAVAGCASSTFDDEGALVKRIGAFGTATTTQLAVAEKIFEEKREDESIVAERRAAMIAANAFYDLSSCVVTPVTPPAATEGKAKPQPCQPRPVVLAADGAAPFAFPPENIRVNAVLNGPRIAAALRDYAASLVEVVEAEDSEAILASTRTALENAKEIAIGVNTARGRPDIPEARLAVFDTASETLPTYLANALNAVKYRMLESVVLEADGAVQAGTHQIATALDALEDESASEMEDALVDAGRELEDAFDEDAEARLARLTEIEEMAAEFRELNDARAALKVGQIAQAHAALAKRFREPDDFAALAESVTAINELVTSTDALVKSIEEAVTAEPDPPEEG